LGQRKKAVVGKWLFSGNMECNITHVLARILHFLKKRNAYFNIKISNIISKYINKTKTQQKLKEIKGGRYRSRFFTFYN